MASKDMVFRMKVMTMWNNLEYPLTVGAETTDNRLKDLLSTKLKLPKEHLHIFYETKHGYGKRRRTPLIKYHYT